MMFAMEPIVIHVDYAPDHEAEVIGRKCEPILSYRNFSTVGLKISDGWVLHTPNGEEWITGCWDFEGVDQAVARSREHLRKVYGLSNASDYMRWVESDFKQR